MRPLGLSFTYQSAFCSFSDSLMCRHVYGRPISSNAMEIFQPFGVSDVSSSIMRNLLSGQAASWGRARPAQALRLLPGLFAIPGTLLSCPMHDVCADCLDL